MSRLAKRPVKIPSGTEVQIKGNHLSFKGPKGTMSHEVPEGIAIEHKGSDLYLSMDENKLDKPMLGLHYSLIKNAVDGVAKGFSKTLTLVGVGFRANQKGHQIELQLGFSHPFQLDVPKGVTIAIDKNTTIVISGVDKQVVGQFAATIRALKSPEPYKGKGVRYENEYVRKKAGKASKGK